MDLCTFGNFHCFCYFLSYDVDSPHCHVDRNSFIVIANAVMTVHHESTCHKFELVSFIYKRRPPFMIVMHFPPQCLNQMSTHPSFPVSPVGCFVCVGCWSAKKTVRQEAPRDASTLLIQRSVPPGLATSSRPVADVA